MTQYRLGEIEAKFAALIWDNEPLTSGRLAELCRETLSWKKSTNPPSFCTIPRWHSRRRTV